MAFNSVLRGNLMPSSAKYGYRIVKFSGEALPASRRNNALWDRRFDQNDAVGLIAWFGLLFHGIDEVCSTDCLHQTKELR